MPPVRTIPEPPPFRRNQRVIFAVLDPDDLPQQGLLASRIVERAAEHRGTELVLLVAGRAAESLGVDATFEARLVARKLDLPAEVVNPDATHEIPGVLSTDLEDHVLAALVNLCPKRKTSDLVETASPAKRGGLFGSFLRRGTETSDSNGGRPVVLLGGTLSPGADRGSPLSSPGPGWT